MVEIKEHVNLSEYTTFRIGGEARFLVDVCTEYDLRQALTFSRQNNLSFFVFSGGSNILFPDNDYNGLIIRIAGDDVHFCGSEIIADAGANLTNLIRKSAKTGLTGWENMCGIPGSVGGAIRGNAGAFGVEIKNVLKRARAFNVDTGELRDFNRQECAFDYRSSFFKSNSQWIILSAIFVLSQVSDTEHFNTMTWCNDAQTPIELCNCIVKERNKRHLQTERCAGSFFKNPICSNMPALVCAFEEDKNTKSKEGRVPAGWLLERCGLKGLRVGGAVCSEQHPNYIVNTGNATQADIIQLASIIKKRVYKKFGIKLEEEVTVVNW